MKKIIVASGNAGKIKEFKSMLEPEGYEVISMKELDGAKEPEETGSTFHDNAILKAQAIVDVFQMPAIADDSGIEIYDLMCHYRDHSGIFDLSDFSTDDYPDVYR